METSPTEPRGRLGQSASSALPNVAARPTVRLPFRPVGALMRCLAPSSPLQAAPLAASLGRRLQHLARAAFINPIGRLAALISVALAGFLVSTVLRGFHANILGIAFGPVDTIFTGMGLLAVIGGIYARVSLRRMIARPMPSYGEPSPGLPGAEGETKQ